MYACDLFGAKFLVDWEESKKKLWGGTQPHFTKQYVKERRKLASNDSNKSYESSAAFRETPPHHTIEAHLNGSTATIADNSFTEAMEYAAALEEKKHAQTERIITLEASMNGQNVLTEDTEYVASAVTAGGNNKGLKDVRMMIKQLTASVTAQGGILESLSVKTHSGGRGGGTNTEIKKAQPGLHVFARCKREVYHRDATCLELAANKSKHYTGWTSVLE